MIALMIVMASSMSLQAHNNFKNIKEGVIKLEGSTYYIISPASKYEIRKADKGVVAKFIKKNNSHNVIAKLVRKHHDEKWKVQSLTKR